jgi:hypothetical protein
MDKFPKLDYDQKVISDEVMTQISRSIAAGFEKFRLKHNLRSWGFKERIHAECQAARRKTKEQKELEFRTKIDDEFPIEFTF